MFDREKQKNRLPEDSFLHHFIQEIQLSMMHFHVIVDVGSQRKTKHTILKR